MIKIFFKYLLVLQKHKMKYKKDKTKHLTIRMEQDLYDAYIKKALDKSNDENRLVKLSEIIREILIANK